MEYLLPGQKFDQKLSEHLVKADYYPPSEEVRPE